jgi:hypothetical protein
VQLIPILDGVPIVHAEKHWLSPYKITDHMRGHTTYLEQPIRCSHLIIVVLEEKIAVKFETKLFTKKINEITLGDMTIDP